jgi:thiamine-phosphate pyrophosphorylase
MTRRHRKSLPTIWLMTDERVSDDALLAAAARLPRGNGGIVFRHYATPPAERRALFERMARIARRRRLVLMLAGTARQAAAWKADGWHGRDRKPATAREVKAAHRTGADLLFLSPLFPTRSHPDARALGPVRFAALACRTSVPVIALGGVHAEHRRHLQHLGAAGWGAIDGIVDAGRSEVVSRMVV